MQRLLIPTQAASTTVSLEEGGGNGGGEELSVKLKSRLNRACCTDLAEARAKKQVIWKEGNQEIRPVWRNPYREGIIAAWGEMKTAYNFIECNREQPYLLPPSLREWLPEGHLVWFILDAVSAMDLSELYGKYRIDGWGGSAYEPSMMASLLVYAYCMGERSSRRIERLC